MAVVCETWRIYRHVTEDRETVCTLFESLVAPVTYKHLNHLYNVQCPTVCSKFKFVSLDFQ